MQQNNSGGPWSLVFGDAEARWRAFEKRPLAADPHKVGEIVSRNMRSVQESTDVDLTDVEQKQTMKD